MKCSIALLAGAVAFAACLAVPATGDARTATQAKNQPRSVTPGPFVVHERGGNQFLYAAPDFEKLDLRTQRPGTPSGHSSTLTNHTDFWSPAWIYKLEGISFGQIASVSVDGQGVRATLVHPGCVTAQQPTGFQQSGPSRCRTLDPGSLVDAKLPDIYLRIEAEAGSAPGPRKLTVRLKSGTRGTTVYPVQVARSGSAALTTAAYVKTAFPQLRQLPDINIGRDSRTLIPTADMRTTGGSQGPIPIADLRAGLPLVGATDPPVFAAPVVELTFAGDGAGSLKLAAPACLVTSSQTTVDANTLRVRARFRVPADPSVATGGIVARRADLPSARCRWVLYDPALDPVIGQQPVHDGNRLSNFTLLDTESSIVRIGPAFLTIAGMGDSYAAGEGAPESFNSSTGHATWESRQCHRSTNSTLTQGAQKLAEVPALWVLFRNFACSGATIHQGMIGPYVGVPLPFGQQQPTPLASQVDQVAAWLAEQDVSEPDALLLSVGGNDVAFGQVVANCLVSPIDCRDHPPLQQAVERGEPGSTAVVGFNNLPAAYEALDQQLRGMKPRAVFITEYPDPLRIGGALDPSTAQLPTMLCNATTTFDDHFAVLPAHLFWGDISADHPLARHLKQGAKIANLHHGKVRWVFDNLLRPLNRAVTTAADKHGWKHIAGFVEHSYDHGFCVRERYINTLEDSIKRAQGDVFGAVHPTKAAYHLYGDVVARELALFFNLPERPSLSVIEESHSQEITRYVLGDTRNPGRSVNRLISAEPTLFRVQLTPTTRSVNAIFEFRRKNRFSGNLIGGVQQIQAAHFSGYQSRLEYQAERTPSLCETLEYRWRIQHTGSGGTQARNTAWRSLTPAPMTSTALDNCPR